MKTGRRVDSNILFLQVSSERCSDFGKIPQKQQSLRKYSLPLHKLDVAFQTESIPWWCQYQIPKMACQEWRFKLPKLIDTLLSIKAQFSFQILVLISINAKICKLGSRMQQQKTQQNPQQSVF